MSGRDGDVLQDTPTDEDSGKARKRRPERKNDGKTDDIVDSSKETGKETRSAFKMPSIPKLNACCCFVNLETGVKILGYVEAILGLLGTLIYGLDLGGVIDLNETNRGFSTEVPPTTAAAAATNETAPSATPKTNTDGELSSGILVVLLIGTIFMATIGMLVLLGVYQRNSAFLKLSVIARCVVLAFFGLSLFVNLIALAMGAETQFTTVIIFGLIIGYNTLVVYSYYLDMQSGTGSY